MSDDGQVTHLGDGYNEVFIQTFESPSGVPVLRHMFNTHLAKGVMPQEWLQIALSAGEAMGITTLPYSERHSAPNRVSYYLMFNNVAQLAQMTLVAEGPVREQRGFHLPLFLEPEDNDITADAYMEAIRMFCEDRGITVQFKEIGDVRIDVIFNSNVDRFAVRSAMEPGKAIDGLIKAIKTGGLPHLGADGLPDDPGAGSPRVWVPTQEMAFLAGLRRH